MSLMKTQLKPQLSRLVAPGRAMLLLVLALTVWVFGGQAALAQDDDADSTVMPPRLAVAEGDVQIWRADGEDDWEKAQINLAMANGDTLYGGDGATVELQIGPSDFARMRGETQLTLVDRDNGTPHFRLLEGEASFDLREGDASRVMRIDTENANISVAGRGYYRLTASDDETTVAVRSNGRVTLTFANGRSRSVGSGQQVVIRGTGDGVDVEISPVGTKDTWDRWNDVRSEYYAKADSNRYLPAGVYGAADLDGNGRWQQESSYGWVWIPTVPVGWAPYSSGSWRWDPVYGWTWVDVAPWGWATSHHGRWVHVRGHWAWAPGPRNTRVVYAPALVSFSVASTGPSWVALGWGEPVLPWWGRPSFRERPWWGGWSGPRRHYKPDYRFRNRDIGHAVVVGRDHKFDPYRGRGPAPAHRAGDPGRNDRDRRPPPAPRHEPRQAPSDGRGPGAHEGRPHRGDPPEAVRDSPVIAVPRRGPGTLEPLHRQANPVAPAHPAPVPVAPVVRPPNVDRPQRDQSDARRDIMPPQPRPFPKSGEPPRERGPVAQPRFAPAAPPGITRPNNPPDRRPDNRPDNRSDQRAMPMPQAPRMDIRRPEPREDRRDDRRESPRMMPRGPDMQPQSPRENPDRRSIHIRRPGDRE